MASLMYDEIFNLFLGNIHDIDFIKLKEENAYELMTEYLKKSLADPTVSYIFATYSMDDTTQTFSYELGYATNEQKDRDFVSVLLSYTMVKCWLKPMLMSKTNIAQFFGNSESKFYSQSNHLSELRVLYDNARLEAKKMVRDRGSVYNSYLGTK